jgi:hypothetical protein
MDWTYRKINNLVKMGILEARVFPYKGRYRKLYSLSDKGIGIAIDKRDEDIFKLDIDGNLHRLCRTANENLISDQLIRHQLFLNEIYFTVLEKIGRSGFEWLDTRKSIINEGNIRIIPDATVKIGVRNYLVEGDNGTFSIKRLLNKFKAYGRFFERAREDYDEEYSVLFICNIEGRHNKEKRIDGIIDAGIAEAGKECNKTGTDFYIMDINNFRENFYGNIYQADIGEEDKRVKAIADKISGGAKYEIEPTYDTMYGKSKASIGIAKDGKTYIIEDLTLGNIKSYERFRGWVKIGKYGNIIPIAIVADKEKAYKEANKIGFAPYVLYYLLNEEKTIKVAYDQKKGYAITGQGAQ